MTGIGRFEEALAGQSVLVTGGAGFIGSHLVERLETVSSKIAALGVEQSVGLVERLDGLYVYLE